MVSNWWQPFLTTGSGLSACGKTAPISGALKCDVKQTYPAITLNLFGFLRVFIKGLRLFQDAHDGLLSEAHDTASFDMRCETNGRFGVL